MPPKSGALSIRFPRRSIPWVVIVPFACLWLAARVTATLVSPGQTAALALAEQMRVKWDVRVTFQSVRWGLFRGLCLSGVRFAKSDADRVIHGSVRTLWVQRSWQKRSPITVVCLRPELTVRRLSGKGSDIAPKGISLAPERWRLPEGLPSLVLMATDGRCQIDGKEHVVLSGVRLFARTSKDRGLSASWEGRTEGWGNGFFSGSASWPLHGQGAASISAKGVEIPGLLAALVPGETRVSGTVEGQLQVRWPVANSIQADLRLSVSQLTSPWWTQDRAELALAARLQGGLEEVPISSFSLSLPGVLELSGNASIHPSLSQVEARLSSLSLDIQSLSKLPFISRIQDLDGHLTVVQADLSCAWSPSLSLSASAQATLEGGAFSSYQDSVALSQVDAQASLTVSCAGSDVLIQVNGRTRVGAFWLEEFEMGHFGASGGVEIALPSGILSIDDVAIELPFGLSASMDDSWVSVRDGQMDLKFDCDHVCLDRASQLLPKAVGKEFAELGLAGIGRATVRVLGSPSADKMGLSDQGLGLMRVDIHTDLSSARGRYEDVDVTMGGPLSADVWITFMKGGVEARLEASGTGLRWAYRGVSCHPDAWRCQGTLLIDSLINQVSLQGFQVRLGDDVAFDVAGRVQSSLLDLKIRSQPAPIPSWRLCTPWDPSLLPGVEQGDMTLAIDARGWQSRSLRVEAEFKGLDYLVTRSPVSTFWAGDMRLILDPLGIPGLEGEVADTAFSMQASNCRLTQEGRVTLEAESLSGGGEIWLDRGAERISVRSLNILANEEIILKGRGALDRGEMGYHGTFQLEMPAFEAEAMARLLPSLRAIGLQGTLTAEGVLTLGNGSNLEEVRGVLRTVNPLTFRIAKTLYEGFEGELPFAQDFVDESELPSTGEVKAQRIAIADTYVLDHPIARGYYVDGHFVAEEAKMGFCGGVLLGRGRISPFDDVPFEFAVTLSGARIAELATRVNPIVGDVFVGEVAGQVEGSGLRDRFSTLEGHLESKGGWMSSAKLMEILDRVPGQPLIDVIQVPMRLLGSLKLDVDIYQESGTPRIRYGIIDPVGLVRDKGEALLSMPTDILSVFIRSPKAKEEAP